MKYTPKIMGRHVRLGNIRASAHSMAAFSGFYDSHEPPPLGDARSAVPAMKVASKGGDFALLFC
jgi:hypothetical protein